MQTCSHKKEYPSFPYQFNFANKSCFEDQVLKPLYPFRHGFVFSSLYKNPVTGTADSLIQL